MYMVKNKSKKSSPDQVAKRTIIAVICLAIITVIIAALCKFLLNDEKISKDSMNAMAAKYYENSLYESLTSDVMDKYSQRGFAPVYLRQLLIDESDQSTVNLIRKHCDENTTSVKFYPDPPYDKKSYRMEFQYDCDF